MLNDIVMFQGFRIFFCYLHLTKKVDIKITAYNYLSIYDGASIKMFQNFRNHHASFSFSIELAW